MKFVKFEGGFTGMYGAPQDLEVGGIYEIAEVLDRGFVTKLVLKGIEGYFNADWFSEVAVIATTQKPTEGHSCHGALVWENGTVTSIHTSPVKAVLQLGRGFYQIRTQSGSLYYVQVR